MIKIASEFLLNWMCNAKYKYRIFDKWQLCNKNQNKSSSSI